MGERLQNDDILKDLNGHIYIYRGRRRTGLLEIDKKAANRGIAARRNSTTKKLPFLRRGFRLTSGRLALRRRNF